MSNELNKVIFGYRRVKLPLPQELEDAWREMNKGTGDMAGWPHFSELIARYEDQAYAEGYQQGLDDATPTTPEEERE